VLPLPETSTRWNEQSAQSPAVPTSRFFVSGAVTSAYATRVNDTRSLEGKVAIVTGSAQGMGRDSALLFAEAGARVVVADIDAERGNETVERIAGAGGEAAFVATDVTSEEQVAAMVAFAVERFGRLDCAHNNAGGGISESPLLETSETDWDRVVDLNLKGAFLCIKHELLHMVDHGGGAVVTTSSAAAYRGSVSRPAYTAAKHGVTGLTRAAAYEVATRGVRVNAICPGVTMTDGLLERRGRAGKEGVDGLDDLVRKNMPIGRYNLGSEIGEAAIWLCSDAASGITGAILAVDGGMSTL
jgi:NAD(P)-dependent dehydrogenase (short-subunit alcohol dehydrogenase family)